MSALDAVLAGPLGAPLAIVAMAAATYLCRVSGMLLMSRVRITPRIERALNALPGAIVAATVVPIALRSGPAGIAAILAGMAVMKATGKELAALLAGMAVAAFARAAGL